MTKTNIPCLFVENHFIGSSKLMIYFHANAEDVGSCFSFIEYVSKTLKINILAVEYPGYGIYKHVKGSKTLLTPSCSQI